MRGRNRWAVAAAGALATLLAAGCGGEEDPLSRASGAPMAPPPGAASAARAPSDNRAPQIDDVAFQPERPVPGGPVRAIVETNDRDGDRLDLRFRWWLNGQPAGGTGPMLSLEHAHRGDHVEVEVVASDGVAESPPFRADTAVFNRPPLVTGIRLEPSGAVTAGSEVMAEPLANDADGDPLSYEFTWWVNGNRLFESDPVLSTVGLERGDVVQVGVVASDGRDESVRVESPPFELQNAPPVIVSQPSGPGPDGVFRYHLRAEDPDRDRPLRFSLVKGPPGMTVASSRGEVVWTPRKEHAGTHVVEIRVEDLRGGQTSQRFQIEVGSEPEETEPAEPGADDVPAAAAEEDER